MARTRSGAHAGKRTEVADAALRIAGTRDITGLATADPAMEPGVRPGAPSGPSRPRGGLPAEDSTRSTRIFRAEPK